MATPTSEQAFSDARYSVIADLGRGESVKRTASFLVMSGWEEADALKFVQVMKDAIDARKVPPRPWEDEEDFFAQEVARPPAGNVQSTPEENEEPREPTAEELRTRQLLAETEHREKRRRQALAVSVSNMKSGQMWFFGGIVFTALGYWAASEVGGGYLVFVGAIIYGAVRFLVGYGGYRRNKPLVKSLD